MVRRGTRSPRAGTEPPDAAAALEVAIRFLGTRPRTRWEVERRLQRAGADADVIDTTLERLASLGYVDDAAFARWWGEQRDRHAPRGHRLIEAELRSRGVAREVIESHREQHAEPERAPEDESLPANEEERAREALARHLRGRAVPADPGALQRLGTFLMRRGFDAGTVRTAIRAAGADLDDGDGA